MSEIIKGTDEFVKSIRYSITKNDIALDVEEMFEELRSTVQPMYESQLSRLIPDKNNKLTNEYSHFMKRSKVKGNDLVTGVKNTIDKLLNTNYESTIIKIINDVVGREINKASLDYRQISVIHYISGLQFFIDTSRKLALIITQDFVGSKDPVVEQYRKDLMIPGIPEAFVTICELIARDPKDLAGDIKHLEGFNYDENNHEAVKNANGAKIDPLRVGMIPLAVHVPYQVGKIRNIWRHNRYERNKDELKKLEFQLLLLEEKKSNAGADEIDALTKRVEYHANRINKLDMKIKNYEES